MSLQQITAIIPLRQTSRRTALTENKRSFNDPAHRLSPRLVQQLGHNCYALPGYLRRVLYCRNRRFMDLQRFIVAVNNDLHIFRYTDPVPAKHGKGTQRQCVMLNIDSRGSVFSSSIFAAVDPALLDLVGIRLLDKLVTSLASIPDFLQPSRNPLFAGPQYAHLP